MGASGLPIQFNETLQDMFDEMNLSQPLPDERASGVVTSWLPLAGTFEVNVDVPEWLARLLSKLGYIVEKWDQVGLAFSRDYLEDESDFRFDPQDFGNKDSTGNQDYGKSLRVKLTRQTLAYMGLA